MPGAEPGPRAGDPDGNGATLRALRGAGDLLARVPRPAAALLALGWMGLVWTLSSGVPPPTPVGFLWASLGNLVHAPLFGILALLFALTLPRDAARARWPALVAARVALVLAVVVAYGAIDEWHQSRVPGRDPSTRDVLIDLVGGTCVLVVAAYLLRADATERGVVKRLVVSTLACVGAAMLAAI